MAATAAMLCVGTALGLSALSSLPMAALHGAPQDDVPNKVHTVIGPWGCPHRMSQQPTPGMLPSSAGLRQQAAAHWPATWASPCRVRQRSSSSCAWQPCTPTICRLQHNSGAPLQTGCVGYSTACTAGMQLCTACLGQRLPTWQWQLSSWDNKVCCTAASLSGRPPCSSH